MFMRLYPRKHSEGRVEAHRLDAGIALDTFDVGKSHNQLHHKRQPPYPAGHPCLPNY